MSTQDDEFLLTLRSTFRVEAEELLQSISSMLLEMEKVNGTGPIAGIVENVFREAHTLKGASRAVDLPDLEAVCQHLEGIFSAWKRQQADPSPEAFDVLHLAIDMMRAMLSPTATNAADSHQQQADLIHRLTKFQFRPDGTPLLANYQPQPAPPSVASSPAVPSPIVAPVELAVEPERSTANDTVRIAINKLDARLLKAESMLVLKSIAATRVSEIRETTHRLGQWQREWSRVSSEARILRQALEHDGESTTPTSAALINFLNWNSDFFRSLETRLQSLSAQAQHDHHEVTKSVDDLLDDSKKLLMLPFSTLASQFPRLVRDLCRDQNKEAELVIRGGEIEIDKRILEEMKDVLIHILRNCIDHGIETPATRQSQNKPPRATITVAVSPVNGNKVEILVSDDGAGVDVQRVKASAVQNGIISQAEARVMGEAEVLRLIFRSDVSTSPVVTTISGRGLGMAIVLAKTENLGGRISLESVPNAGTVFHIVLPLTLATFRGILVTVAGRTFVVPTSQVERVLRVKSQDIQTVQNREVISLHDKAVSLVRLQTILEIENKSGENTGAAFLSVVVIHSADQRIALVVDQVLHEEEVLVKPLHKPLVRVRNIAGATVLGSGTVAPVLNVPDLMKSARTAGAVPVAALMDQKPQKQAVKRVLVAEDSITSRMLLKGILETAGYSVHTAVDGVDAFTALREQKFELVVSDVEMPRMNGFDLTARIRSDQQLSELPVVLITALESREQRERGIDAGANAYVIKKSFDQQNLLEVIRRLI